MAATNMCSNFGSKWSSPLKFKIYTWVYRGGHKATLGNFCNGRPPQTHV